MNGALEGTLIVDLSSYLSGPYCSMLLADAGANVIKVERPGVGDEMRRFPPFLDGESAAFMLLNRNKRSMTLDLKNEADLAALRQLLAQADVMIESFRPGVIDRLGLGYEEVSQWNPRLVHCSISGFGQTGPYRDRGGFDLIAQGMSGLMAMNADPDGSPRRLPIPISDMCAGMFAALGITMALNARHRTGRGQQVDASLFDAAVCLGVYEAASFFATGQRPESPGQGHRGSAPYQAFRASDGWLTLGAGAQELWLRFCRVLDMEHLAADPRFLDAPARVAHRAELAEVVQSRMAARPREEWLKALEEAGIPAGPILNYDEVYADPQVIERQLVKEILHPSAGPVRVLGHAVKLGATPNSTRSPAPLLGQHKDEIEKEYRLREPTG